MRHLIAFLVLMPSLVFAEEPVKLGEDSYKPELGIILFEANWGRTWKCGEYQNAQLQALAFTKSPVDDPGSSTLELVTPSKLLAKNEFVPYALVIQPGEYVLTGFDVKIARSVSDIAHIKGTKEYLVKDGKPVGGSFKVGPGEIVYVGHFGLDCGAEPFLWRYFLLNRKVFEEYVDDFRKQYPFVKDVPVQYRLFSTRLLGLPVGLENSTVK